MTLEEENEKLKTALRKIKNEEHCSACSHRSSGYLAVCRCFFKLAKEVLDLL